MTHVLVRKLNSTGQVVISYDGDIVDRSETSIVLAATWSRPLLDLGYTVFEPGARFLEWFFTDRWYNIFQIHGVAGDLRGWYCNVAAPAVISETEIDCRDLYLDLWVTASGDTLLLDEDEFNADLLLDDETRTHALAAVHELRAMVQHRAPPFDGISTLGG